MALRLFALLVCIWIAQGASAQIVTQTSTVRGVTVAATAGNLNPEASVWDFAVVLSSSSAALPDDLVRSAVLVDPQGRRYKPLIWEGAPHTGTHRGGVLKFIAVRPRPGWVELRIERAGESRPRKFGWFLGTGLSAKAQLSHGALEDKNL